MDEKYYVKPDDLLYDSFRLAKKIYDSDFKPTFIVGLWRGGSTIAIAMHEFLTYKGIKTQHIPSKTSGYETGINQQKKQVQVDLLEYIVREANVEDRLLIVDDIYDTGRSIDSFIETLKKESRANMPQELKVATVFYKPLKNQTSRVPDYYLHETDQWVVFPHELVGLSLAEIEAGKSKKIANLLK